MFYTTKSTWLALIAILLAGALLLHQGLLSNEWFNCSQFWHHESLIAIAITFAFTILLFGK